MGDNIIIQKYQEKDYEPYRKLFKEVFQRELEEKIFEWKYLKNPYGSAPLIYLAKDGEGNLLGARSLFPTELWVDGEAIPAVQAGDTMVRKESRGKGLFSRLTRYSIDDVRALGFQVVFNFPNQNSYPGYMKLGWTDLDEVENYYRILDPSQMLKRKLKSPALYKPLGGILRSMMKFKQGITQSAKALNEIRVIKSEVIKEDMADFLSKNLTKPVHQTKSITYLQWRYENNPKGEYEILEFWKDEARIGTVVTKILGRNEQNTVEVLEWAANKEMEELLLEKLMNYYSKENMALLKLWQLGKQTGIKPLLEKLGFVRKSTDLHFVVKPLGADNAFNKVTDSNNWYVHKGDTDTA